MGFNTGFGFPYIRKAIPEFVLDRIKGAAAAYSVRKLSRNATKALRVRRSIDDAEQDIGFVGTELDTATLLDFVNARDVAPADYGAGAAAAYSLRYVSDSYTGDVVRVRRDSDNAEADFNPTAVSYTHLTLPTIYSV